MGPSYSPLPDGRAVHMSEDPERSVRVGGEASRSATRRRCSSTTRGSKASPRCSDHCSRRCRLGWARSARATSSTSCAPCGGSRASNVRTAADTTRLFTMSIADLLREWFESPAVQGLMAVNGIIGTWGGPEAPGTAYVMLHHSIGDVGAGHLNAWGYPEGGTGAVSDAIRRAAESLGTTVRTNAPVERVLVRDGRVTGVALADGPRSQTDLVVTAIHPKITFLRQIDERDLPDDFVRRIRNWKTRSGTVKVNVALSELPDFVADPGTRRSRTTPGRSRSVRHSSTSSTRTSKPSSGVASDRPFSDGVIPSTMDRTICPDGTHVMSLFTQWVPASWADDPHPDGARGLRRSRDRRLRRGRAELPALDHPPAGDRPVRDGAHVRAHRRKHLPRRAHRRPAVPQPAGGGIRRLPQPDRRSLPGPFGDTRGWRHHRHPRMAGRPSRARRQTGGAWWRISDDGPPACADRRRRARRGARAVRAEPHAPPRGVRRRGGARLGARRRSSKAVGCARAASPTSAEPGDQRAPSIGEAGLLLTA